LELLLLFESDEELEQKLESYFKSLSKFFFNLDGLPGINFGLDLGILLRLESNEESEIKLESYSTSLSIFDFNLTLELLPTIELNLNHIQYLI